MSARQSKDHKDFTNLSIRQLRPEAAWLLRRAFFMVKETEIKLARSRPEALAKNQGKPSAGPWRVMQGEWQNGHLVQPILRHPRGADLAAAIGGPARAPRWRAVYPYAEEPWSQCSRPSRAQTNGTGTCSNRKLDLTVLDDSLLARGTCGVWTRSFASTDLTH